MEKEGIVPDVIDKVPDQVIQVCTRIIQWNVFQKWISRKYINWYYTHDINLSTFPSIRDWFLYYLLRNIIYLVHDFIMRLPNPRIMELWKCLLSVILNNI